MVGSTVVVVVVGRASGGRVGGGGVQRGVLEHLFEGRGAA